MKKGNVVLLLMFILSLLSISGGKVVEKELKNGSKIIIEQTKGEGIVAGILFLKGGQHGEKLKGETNLLFTLLLKGSKRFPTSYEVSLPFEKYGGQIYASSGEDFSEIGFTTTVEGLKEAFEVLKDILSNPLFKEEDLEREKRNTIVAIRSKRERGFSFAMEHLRKLTYKGSPYEISPSGLEEDISKVKREDLIRRMKEVIVGGNAVLVLVGDFKKEDVLPLAEELLTSLPEGNIELFSSRDVPKEDKVVKVKREGTQATVLCAFGAPPKDSDEYYAFKVFTSLLGDGMTSLLFKELRERKGYAYATFAFYPTRYAMPRLFAYVGTSPEKSESALADLIDIVKNPNFSEEDIKIAKNKIVGDFLLDHQTRLRRAWYLGFYEVMGLGWETDKKYTERIMGVSEKEIKGVIERYIKNHHCVVVEP